MQLDAQPAKKVEALFALFAECLIIINSSAKEAGSKRCRDPRDNQAASFLRISIWFIIGARSSILTAPPAILMETVKTLAHPL
jgi:hypothetical protein